MIIGSSTAPASGLAATFQINGQGGGDSLIINDAFSSTGRTISLNGATSTVSGLGGPITYGTLESLELFAGTGADTINISGTAAALTSVYAGDGADTVNFANGASLSGGLLDGGAGTDTIDYTAYTSPVTVDLNEPSGNPGTATGTGGLRGFENATGGSEHGRFDRQQRRQHPARRRERRHSDRRPGRRPTFRRRGRRRPDLE